MARGFMSFMPDLDITRAIERVGLKVKPVLGPFGAKTGEFDWYFYANENTVVVSGPKHLTALTRQGPGVGGGALC